MIFVGGFPGKLETLRSEPEGVTSFARSACMSEVPAPCERTLGDEDREVAGENDNDMRAACVLWRREVYKSSLHCAKTMSLLLSSLTVIDGDGDLDARGDEDSEGDS